MPSYARGLAAKTMQACGLVIVGIALLIGLRDNDMARELMALGFGSIVFCLGYAIESR